MLATPMGMGVCPHPMALPIYTSAGPRGCSQMEAAHAHQMAWQREMLKPERSLSALVNWGGNTGVKIRRSRDEHLG